MPNVCKACGGSEPQILFNYCKSCVAAHTRGEMTLGGCQGCDVMAERQAMTEEEMKDETPSPGT